MADNDDIRKINTKSLRLESRGDEYVETFMVTGLLSTEGWEPWDAYNAPNIPHKNDLKNDIADTGTLICTHIAIEPMESSVGGDYLVEVTWSSPSGNTFPDTDQAVYWSIGTQGQRIDTSFEGAPIGDRALWGLGQPTQSPYVGDYGPIGRYDQDADIGEIIATPTVEIEIVPPKKTTAGYLLGPAAVAELTGTVNSQNFSFASGGPGGQVEIVTILPGFTLFQGAQIEPYGTNAAYFRTVYRLTLGMAHMPWDIPQYLWGFDGGPEKHWYYLGTPHSNGNHDGQPWVNLPIRFGYTPVYKARGHRLVDPQPEPPPDPPLLEEYDFDAYEYGSFDNYVRKTLLQMNLWEAYPQDSDTGYSFGQLGIWDGAT